MKNNNSQENKAKLSFMLGSLMGDILKSTEAEDKYSIISKYNVNLEKATNDEIKGIIKNILADFPKYSNKELKDILNELNLSGDYIELFK